ncbi:unnamed protein product [Durusdinium trenchii]
MEADGVSYNAAISACEKEQWQMALLLFQEMLRQHLEASVISFSSSISACEKGSRWTSALDLMDLLHCQAQMAPNLVTYNAAIAACAHCFHWRHASELLMSLRKEALQADMITGLLMSGLFEEAELGLALGKMLVEVERIGSGLTLYLKRIPGDKRAIHEPSRMDWICKCLSSKVQTVSVR